MENAQTAVTMNAVPACTEKNAALNLAGIAPVISAKRLAFLNYGLFFNLRSLGTQRDRVCEVMGLSSLEFDYLMELSRT